MVVKMRENFSKFTVGEWIIICGRGHSAKWWRQRKKQADIFDLCKKAVTMKQIKIAASAKDCKKLLKEKLQTSEGKSPVQKIFIPRTYHLSFLSPLKEKEKHEKYLDCWSNYERNKCLYPLFFSFPLLKLHNWLCYITCSIKVQPLTLHLEVWWWTVKWVQTLFSI